MYTYIELTHAITILRKMFTEFESETKNLPLEELLETIKTITNCNIFEFGDTKWIQLRGTAMGTPFSCMLATFYVGYFERTVIIPKYGRWIIWLRRLIDDMIGLWKDDGTEECENAWVSFNADMQTFGQLEWIIEERSDSIEFLDIQLTINPKTRYVTLKSHEKPQNLFLYIPHAYARHPGLVKSLVFGQV